MKAGDEGRKCPSGLCEFHIQTFIKKPPLNNVLQPGDWLLMNSETRGALFSVSPCIYSKYKLRDALRVFPSYKPEWKTPFRQRQPRRFKPICDLATKIWSQNYIKSIIKRLKQGLVAKFTFFAVVRDSPRHIQISKSWSLAVVNDLDNKRSNEISIDKLKGSFDISGSRWRIDMDLQQRVVYRAQDQCRLLIPSLFPYEHHFVD